MRSLSNSVLSTSNKKTVLLVCIFLRTPKVTPLLGMASSSCNSARPVGTQLVEETSHQRGPARLVAGAATPYGRWPSPLGKKSLVSRAAAHADVRCQAFRKPRATTSMLSRASHSPPEEADPKDRGNSRELRRLREWAHQGIFDAPIRVICVIRGYSPHLSDPPSLVAILQSPEQPVNPNFSGSVKSRT